MARTRRSTRLASQQHAPAADDEAGKQESAAAPVTTPKSSRSAFSFLGAITQRLPKTPNDASPIKPADAEMHPKQHHQTTSTPHEEARWLGFFNMPSVPQTAPVATAPVFTALPASPTPVKKPLTLPSAFPVAGTPSKATASTQDFKFTFRREPSVELSKDAQRIMAESREEAARIRAQLASLPSIPDTDPDVPSSTATGRKIAKPKSRFSDVHKKTFNQMDSIANHASAWRADANHIKKSPMKTDSNKVLSTGLKRSPSKAELDKSTPNQSPSKTNIHTPTFVSTIARPIRLNTASSDMDDKPLPAAKRVKQSKDDDAGSTRPKQIESSAISTPRRETQGLVRSKSGLLRPGFSSAMSPTKASMARIQNAQCAKSSISQIPAIVRSKSVSNLGGALPSALPRLNAMHSLNANMTPRKTQSPAASAAPSPSPVKVALHNHDMPIHGPDLRSSPAPQSTPKRVKSILRTPNRRYTRDPLKIAAGTHLATPPKQVGGYPIVPSTAPVIKRVDFSASTKDKAERDTMKSASVEPESIAYPELATENDPNRRTTLMALPTMPGAFTFRSDQEIVFDTSRVSTIRAVRSSDVGTPKHPPSFSFAGVPSTPSPAKRTLHAVIENQESEKENNGDDNEEQRPAKKARTASSGPKSAPVTPAKATPAKSRLPRFGSAFKRTGGLTAARLSLLAKPKRRD